jgi:C4-dicarboxylate-specific signal transduction histidine kinase
MAQQNEERKFLHEISSPLTTIQLNLDSALMILEDQKPEEFANALLLLKRCLDQSKRAGAMVRERREVIIASEKE